MRPMSVPIAGERLTKSQRQYLEQERYKHLSPAQVGHLGRLESAAELAKAKHDQATERHARAVARGLEDDSDGRVRKTNAARLDAANRLQQATIALVACRKAFGID